MTDVLPASAIGVWERLLKDLGGDYPVSFFLFSPAYSLLSDAIRSYDAEAVQATCAMCRAAAEATCYIFLTRKKEHLTGEPHSARWNIEYPVTLAGRPREVSFDELVDGIRQKQVLSSDDLAALMRIKNDGNFSVHAASRQDRVLHRLVPSSSARAEHGARAGLVEPIRIWVSKSEAFQNIVDTAKILGKLVRAAGPWLHPQPDSPKT